MIRNTALALAVLPLVSACTEMSQVEPVTGPEATEAEMVETAAAPVPVLAPPPPSARTEEEFDTTTVEERAAASAAPADPAGEVLLGTTVASLGDPARSGFWIETPLTDDAGPGRVVYPATGLSSQVEIIPIPGEATAGSRLSLSAMRLIEAPLTDLPTVELYEGTPPNS
ncbi:hypothetical protein [Litorisediminicola beolgyonensis]|uniref:D-galactarate dehydratase n=1 Tax=Litorisediminicola beolgyonensis TaxID=1173614 RepID=A0ABW3ZM57_9RHOB